MERLNFILTITDTDGFFRHAGKSKEEANLLPASISVEKNPLVFQIPTFAPGLTKLSFKPRL
jgi:hypothetical protein